MNSTRPLKKVAATSDRGDITAVDLRAQLTRHTVKSLRLMAASTDVPRKIHDLRADDVFYRFGHLTDWRSF